MDSASRGFSLRYQVLRFSRFPPLSRWLFAENVVKLSSFWSSSSTVRSVRTSFPFTKLLRVVERGDSRLTTRSTFSPPRAIAEGTPISNQCLLLLPVAILSQVDLDQTQQPRQLTVCLFPVRLFCCPHRAPPHDPLPSPSPDWNARPVLLRRFFHSRTTVSSGSLTYIFTPPCVLCRLVPSVLMWLPVA